MKMEILAESAIRVTALAVGVALVLRLLRIRSPRLAHAAWAVVMVVMLLLPLVVASGAEFAVPLLPAQSTSARLAPSAASVPEPADTPAPVSVSMASRATARLVAGITWATAALIVYLAGLGLLLLRLGIGLRHVRAIRRDAIETHGRLTHPACMTPMTVGLVAPAVILPQDWTGWDRAELEAVLAHELEHVRRRDPLVAAVALVNRAVFWFHPLAWWLQREVGRLSEQACDAVVIASGHDRHVYAGCLLRFARRASDAGGRVAPTAVAMPGSGLRNRLGMLAGPQLAAPSGSRLTCAAVACAGLVIVCAAAVPTAAPFPDGTAGRRQPLSRIEPTERPDSHSGNRVSRATRDAKVTPAQDGSPGRQALWRIETSEHFDVVHASLPANRVSDAIRDAEAAYSKLTEALKYDIPRRVAIVLVPRDRDINETVGDVPLAQRGMAGEQRVVLSLESLEGRPGAVVHELTHQFAADIIPVTSRLSPYLIEGLAEHQTGEWNAQDLRLMRADVAAGAIPSVASLGPSDRHWARAVFDFAAAQNGAEGVRRLLFALRTRETLPHAVPMAFDITPDQFDLAFRGYVTTTFGPP